MDPLEGWQGVVRIYFRVYSAASIAVVALPPMMMAALARSGCSAQSLPAAREVVTLVDELS